MGDGDVLIISGNYKVKAGASVTLEDGDGTRGEFVYGQNAKITDTKDGDLRIEVTAEPKIVKKDSDDGILDTEGLVVVKSSGVTITSGNGGQRHQHHRGGRANKINCEQTLDQTLNQTVPETESDFFQYSNADQIQYCIINNARRGGGGDNGGNNVTLEYNNDENITTQTQPEGQVLDTSAVSQLPFTGGFVPISVAASIAGIALFSAGAGVSLWQLRGRRGRSDD